MTKTYTGGREYILLKGPPFRGLAAIGAGRAERLLLIWMTALASKKRCLEAQDEILLNFQSHIRVLGNALS